MCDPPFIGGVLVYSDRVIRIPSGALGTSRGGIVSVLVMADAFWR